MKGKVALLLLVLTTTCLIASNAPSYIILRERRAVATVTDNPTGLIGIVTHNPIEVYEYQEIQDNRLFSLTNNLGILPMYIISILPVTMDIDHYKVTVQKYDIGPYALGEECQVFVDIEGKEDGSYVEIYEIKAYWGSDYSSASALVHVYNIEVEIIVCPTESMMLKLMSEPGASDTMFLQVNWDNPDTSTIDRGFKPVQGAEVFYLNEGTWTSIGTTDSNGLVKIEKDKPFTAGKTYSFKAACGGLETAIRDFTPF